MRNLRKIFHFLFAWGMVPLIVWSGCPAVGCACGTVTKELASCGCCAPEKASAKKSCCCRAKEHSENPATASIGSPPNGIDLGLLAHCGCGRIPSSSTVTVERERKSAGEEILVQADEGFLAHEPDPPFTSRGVLPSVSFRGFDRVVLFCAFLI